MQKYDDLWQAIEVRVRENNDITLNDWTTDSVRGHAARQRIAQIFILEVLLARIVKSMPVTLFPSPVRRRSTISSSNVPAGSRLK